jgi:hypothetical protein
MEREPVASTQEQRPGVKAFYTMLEQQGWEVHRFSLTEGAQYHVPKQASAVMILGAQAPLRESEWSAIERYLQQGGALFLALDIKNFPPDRNLLEKLHLKLVPGLVTNPRHHLQINPLDDSRPFPMATHLLAPHPSVARLEQYAQQLWVNMLGAGALLADRPPARWHVDFPLRAMPQSYMAHPNNGKFLAQDAEDNYQLVAAIEGPFAAHSSQSARIIVTTDVDMLSDALFDQLGNTYWALDSMHWLLHQDESPQHLPMVSLPEDSPLTHRREHEIGWFYLTSLCLPGCIALIGCISQARKGLLKAG